MVIVKFYNALGDECSAEYTESEHAQLLERQRALAEQVRPDLDAIDHALSPHLRKELEKVNAETRVTARAKTDFKMFQACCAKWGLPDLPAPPQAVAVFLSERSEDGAAVVSRLARSISIVHTACNFSDPTTDILPRAILRLVRSEKKSSPQKKDN